MTEQYPLLLGMLQATQWHIIIGAPLVHGTAVAYRARSQPTLSRIWTRKISLLTRDHSWFLMPGLVDD